MRPRSVAVAIGSSLLALLTVLACARTPKSEAVPAPIAPIDWSPRCLAIEGLPDLAAPLEATLPDAILTPIALPRGIEGWAWTGPPSPYVVIAAGFVWPRPARADAEVAATALREALTTEAPAATRAHLAATGAVLRVDVEADRLWLSVAVPHAHADELVPIVAALLDIHDLDDDVFGRTRRRTRLAQLALESAPTAVARARFDRWRGDAVADPKAVTRDPAEHGAMMRTVLAPGRSTRFLLIGPRPEDAPRLRAQLSDWLASWPDDAAPSQLEAPRDRRGTPTEQGTLEPGDVLLVDRPGSPQVEVLVALPTGAPEAGDERDDTTALELLASAVGGNVGGRLFADLRERRGLVYTIDAKQDERHVFLVSTRARAERVPALLAGIEAHLRALAEVPFLPCEVEIWQQRLLGERALRAADPAAVQAELRRALSGRGAEPVDTLPDVFGERDAILALDAATLGDVARRHLIAAPVIVLVGDRSQLEAVFETVAPERRLREIDEHGRVD